MEWSLWIGVAAVIAGTGKFLDEYHVRRHTRTWLQGRLTEWFLVIDGVAVPDPVGFVLRPFDGTVAPLLLVGIGCALMAWPVFGLFTHEGPSDWSLPAKTLFTHRHAK